MKEKKVLTSSSTNFPTDFCSGHVTLKDTIFIYDPFLEESYREISNEIKYPLTSVQGCYDLMSQPFVKLYLVIAESTN